MVKGRSSITTQDNEVAAKALKAAVAARQSKEYLDLVNKYSERLNRTHFFLHGFLRPFKVRQYGTDYHYSVSTNYFNNIVWQNVGKYMYKGMEELEHEKPETHGIKAQVIYKPHGI